MEPLGTENLTNNNKLRLKIKERNICTEEKTSIRKAIKHSDRFNRKRQIKKVITGMSINEIISTDFLDLDEI